MASKVHIANAVNDIISINLNNGLQSIVLNPRTLATSGRQLTMNVATYNIGPNRDKGIFGTSAKNTVQVEFTSLQSVSPVYSVQVDSSVLGRDLYFYVFVDTMEGQDDTGNASGITITRSNTVQMRFD